MKMLAFKLGAISSKRSWKELPVSLAFLLAGLLLGQSALGQTTAANVKWADRSAKVTTSRLFAQGESAEHQQRRISAMWVPSVEEVPALARTISVEFSGITLVHALNRIAAKGSLDIAYLQETVATDKPVTLKMSSVSVRDALQEVVRGIDLRFVHAGGGQLVLVPRPAPQKAEFQKVGFEEKVAFEKKTANFQLVRIPTAGIESERIQHIVSGTVTDASSGEPLPGVNVQVVGTTLGVATDPQGQYELDVPSPTDTLRFTFVGYESRTVPIQRRSRINVTMEPTTLTGGEVVVIGYSTQQRKDLTGAVDVVDVETMQRIPEAQIPDQLQGMASGVSVISSGQPGKDPQIRIRGINTFGNNEPLYVVDGVPTQSIGNLDPNDITSLQVLKDASAATIYGARASNGVVIIETRKGDGDVTVQVNSYAGVSQQPDESNPFDVLISPGRRAELTWLAHRNSGVPPSSPQFGSGEEPRIPDFIRPAGAMEGDPGTDPSDYFVIPEYTDPAQLQEFHQIVRANRTGTDWFDELMETAPQTKTDLTVSGGGEQGSFLFSAGYLNQQSTLMEAFLERYSLRANTAFNKDFEGVINSVRIGENLSYTVEENKLAEELVEDDPINSSFQTRPIIPVRDIMGNWAGNGGGGLGDAGSPISEQARTRNDQNLDKRLFGNAFIEITFLDDFRFKTLIGGSASSGFAEQFQFPEYENSENNTANALTERAWNHHDWTWTNTLNYQHTFARRHNVTALAGVEWVKQNTRFEEAGVESFFSFDPNFTNLSNGAGTKTIGSGTTVSMLASQFGKVDYNYAGRYFLSGTLRRDASSKFLLDRYGLFPAFSLGWRISEEPFMEGLLPWLTDLKLRSGWGVMGNQFNVTPNNAYTLFGSIPYGYDISAGNAGVDLGFRESQIGAPGAQWEKDKNLNIGIDLAVFDGQVEATVDYYRKDIEDLLFNPELPATGGQADPPFINVASMVNTGVDASLRGQTQLGGVQVEGSVNFTTYNNEITGIAEGFDSFSEESRRFNAQNIVRNEVGHEMSSYYGFRIVGFWNSQGEIEQANAQAPDGLYQAEAAPGRFRYEDVNGDGEITFADRTFLGSPNPDFTYGINLNVGYRSWDLSVSLFGSQGAELWNQVKWWTDFFSTFNNNKSKEALEESWKPDADNSGATVPIQELGRSFSTNQVPNSYFVENGSYLRIQNLQIGYTLPAMWVQRLGAQELRLYVQASNLYTFTGYSNPEPEVGANDPTDVTSFGIDSGAFPTPRQFIGGVNLTF